MLSSITSLASFWVSLGALLMCLLSNGGCRSYSMTSWIASARVRPAISPANQSARSIPTFDETRGVLYVSTGDNYSQPGNSDERCGSRSRYKGGKAALGARRALRESMNTRRVRRLAKERRNSINFNPLSTGPISHRYWRVCGSYAEDSSSGNRDIDCIFPALSPMVDQPP